MYLLGEFHSSVRVRPAAGTLVEEVTAVDTADLAGDEGVIGAGGDAVDADAAGVVASVLEYLSPR